MRIHIQPRDYPHYKRRATRPNKAGILSLPIDFGRLFDFIKNGELTYV